METENKEPVATPQPADKKVPMGQYGFRRSDRNGAVLQIVIDGKYTDICTHNIDFDGCVSLISHLYTDHGIYVLVNQYTGLVEAVEQIHGVFINYTYDAIVAKMSPAPKEEA